LKLNIYKVKKISGTINIPGDKSVSHRSLILGSIARGEMIIENFLFSDDCLRTLECLRNLGVEIQITENNLVRIKGKGLHGLREPKIVLDVGNSGTTIRLLAGLLSGQQFYSVLDGDSSIKKRPMKRIVEPLRLMGAQIFGREDSNFAPLSINGSQISAISYSMPVASAQVKSAIMLAGLFAAGETVINEPLCSRDHTERMLGVLQADIEVNPFEIKIRGGKELQNTDIIIPGDISSAAYFIAAASVLKGSDILIKSVGINPTRTGILEILKKMGAKIDILNYKIISNEPQADLRIKYSELKGMEIGKEIIPSIIDELPLLAVVATQAKGKTVIKGAGELRVKETDRIKAIVDELKKMNADIIERADGFIINGPTTLHGGVFSSHNDHRIAMSLSIAGLLAQNQSIIENSECINISFPGFEQVLQYLIE